MNRFITIALTAALASTIARTASAQNERGIPAQRNTMTNEITFILIAIVTAMISGSPLVAIVPITAALLFESAARINAQHSALKASK